MTTLNLFQNSKAYDTFTAGQTIFKQGQPANFMYVVTEGQVEVKVNGKVVGLVGPGEMLGEIAVIESGTRSATAVAQTECKMVPVSREQFEYLVNNTPFFATSVMQIITYRLRQMNERIA